MLLAIIKPKTEDESYSNFMESLPDQSQIFSFEGYIGGLEDNLRAGFDKGYRRYFLIFSDSIEYDNTEYFRRYKWNSLSIPPRGFALRIIYQQHIGREDIKNLNHLCLLPEGTCLSERGPINAVVDEFEQLIEKIREDPKEILYRGLRSSEYLKERLAETIATTPSNSRVKPRHPTSALAGIELETSDMRLILKATEIFGPFKAEIPEHLIRVRRAPLK